MSKQAKHFYEFGPFRLDAAERVLLRDGVPVTLPPKAFDTLLVLVQRNGHILEKDELIKSVWPDTFVEENNLTQYVSTLRKALNGSQEQHLYIETIPRRGYRFVAGVKELWGADAELVLAKHTRSHVVIREEEEEREEERESTNVDKEVFPTASPLPRRRRLTRPLLFISILLVGLTTVFSYLWVSSKSRQKEREARVRSIAVLPFKPMGAEGGDEYLGLGMADALITKLGQIGDLNVRPTGAGHKYAGIGQDPVAAGRELGVDIVLDGQIQRSGERVHVTARLVSVPYGAPLWAEKFDENYQDIFKVQDSISEQVSRTLMLKLTDREKRQLSKHYTENPLAYQLYIKGRYFWNKRTDEGFKKAIEYFQQAVETDPNYAQAHTGLADCYNFIGLVPKAKEEVAKALEIDETLPEAHTSLANTSMFYDWDWLTAEKEFKRAIELNPHYATAHHWYAYYLAVRGSMNEALAEIKRAQEIDPLSLVINTDIGHLFYLARQYNQATAQLNKTLEMDPNFAMAHYRLAQTYEQMGVPRLAITEFQKVGDLSGDSARGLSLIAQAYAVAGMRTEAQQALNEVLKGLSQGKYIPPYNIAEIYAGLGDKDQAFTWLEKAYDEHEGELILIKIDPSLDSLRSDPRFASLLQRIGLAL